MLAGTLQGQFTALQYLDFFTRILVACFCGAMIGLERSKRLKEAGIRTHIVVCCAAALMMLVSKYAYADMADAGAVVLGSRGADPSRVAAQVVSGISFLGAGVIFKQGGSIKGLTTAAGLWATAGIGLALGAGMYIVGLFTAATMLVFQVVMHKFSIGGDSMISSHFLFTMEDDEDFEAKLNGFLNEQRMYVSDMKIAYPKEGLMSYDMVVRMPHDVSVDAISRFLRDIGHVQQISYTSAG